MKPSIYLYLSRISKIRSYPIYRSGDLLSTTSRPPSPQPAEVLPQPAAHGYQFSPQPAAHACHLSAPRGRAPREQLLRVLFEDARDAHASEHGERHHGRDEQAHHCTARHPAAVRYHPAARWLPGVEIARRRRRRCDGLGEARLHLAHVLPHLGGVGSRRFSGFGRASRPHRSLPLCPERLSGSHSACVAQPRAWVASPRRPG